MGVDCRLWCQDCNDTHPLGRAYAFNQDFMNRKLPAKEIYDKLSLLAKRFVLSLRESGLYAKDYDYDWNDDLLEFLKGHKEHDVWLINDFFDDPSWK